MPGLIMLESVTANPRRVKGKVVQNESVTQVWVSPEDVSRVEPEGGVTSVTTRDGKRYRSREGVTSLAGRINTALGLSAGGLDLSSVSSLITAMSGKVDLVLARPIMQEGVQLGTDVDALRTTLADDIGAALSLNREIIRSDFVSETSTQLAGFRTNLALDMDLDSRLSGLRVDIGADLNLDTKLSNLRVGIGTDLDLDTRLSGLRTGLNEDMDLDVRLSSLRGDLTTDTASALGSLETNLLGTETTQAGPGTGMLGAITAVGLDVKSVEVGVVDLSAGVNLINTTTSGISSTVSSMNTTLGAVNATVGTVSTNVNTIRTTTTGISSTVNTINTRTTNIQTSVNSIGETQTTYFNANTSTSSTFTFTPIFP